VATSRARRWGHPSHEQGNDWHQGKTSRTSAQQIHDPSPSNATAKDTAEATTCFHDKHISWRTFCAVLVTAESRFDLVSLD
jgi:hypothetical protein